jgi:hypothetical protein
MMLTTSGLIFLLVASFFQALQAVLEQGIFMKDPDLNPLCLVGGEAVWKLFFMLIFGPFYNFIKVSTDLSASGTLENFGAAIYDLQSDQALMILVLLNALFVGLAHAFGAAIIKYEDAVLSTTITLMIILTTWLFFLAWPYQGHEDFNFLTLIGMILLGTGSYLYIMAENKNKEKGEDNKVQVDFSINFKESLLEQKEPLP